MSRGRRVGARRPERAGRGAGRRRDGQQARDYIGSGQDTAGAPGKHPPHKTRLSTGGYDVECSSTSTTATSRPGTGSRSTGRPGTDRIIGGLELDHQFQGPSRPPKPTADMIVHLRSLFTRYTGTPTTGRAAGPAGGS
jgi:hypothetical protein